MCMNDFIWGKPTGLEIMCIINEQQACTSWRTMKFKSGKSLLIDLSSTDIETKWGCFCHLIQRALICDNCHETKVQVINYFSYTNRKSYDNEVKPTGSDRTERIFSHKNLIFMLRFQRCSISKDLSHTLGYNDLRKVVKPWLELANETQKLPGSSSYRPKKVSNQLQSVKSKEYFLGKNPVLHSYHYFEKLFSSFWKPHILSELKQ